MRKKRYKVYSTVLPHDKKVTEDELEHYAESVHWKIAGETTPKTIGANVMTESDSTTDELATKTDENGDEVVELGAPEGEAIELSKAPETMEIDPDSPQAEAWLTDVEREKLRQASDKERQSYDESKNGSIALTLCH